MYLWRPSAHSRNYAYAQQISGEDTIEMAHSNQNGNHEIPLPLEEDDEDPFQSSMQTHVIEDD